jgi:hypothetical protein
MKLPILSTQVSPSLSRREFIRLAGLASTAFAVLGCAGDDGGDAAACDQPGGPCLPTLGGAPDRHDGHVIAAFVDTIVPGRHRDPEGQPGGIDVGAPALFFDPALPALGYVNLLVTYLDGTARGLFGRDFAEASPEERDAAVEQALASFAPMEFAVQLAKLAYYSTAAAGQALGYPGPNPGYVDDPDFSFGVALTTEITGDGNLP